MPRDVADRGQGRKKGGLNARTKAIRAIADEALASGKHPLDVMLKNMRFYDDHAEALIKKIGEHFSECDVIRKSLEGIKLPKDKLPEAVKLANVLSTLVLCMTELYGFKGKAEGCAVDAAPYVHAKLSATHVEADITHHNADAESAYRIVAGIVEATPVAPAIGNGSTQEVVVAGTREPADAVQR